MEDRLGGSGAEAPLELRVGGRSMTVSLAFIPLMRCVSWFKKIMHKKGICWWSVSVANLTLKMMLAYNDGDIVTRIKESILYTME